MKIGIFGGSFDPIHIGHITLVRRALDLLQLDRVVVIPAFVSPFKVEKPPRASEVDRLQMVKLAFFDQKDVEVSDIEIKKRGVSYTIDTIRELKSQYSNTDELFLLLIEDQVSTFPRWKAYEEILALAHVVILSPLTYRFWNEDGKGTSTIPWIDICSSTIRYNLKLGKDCKEFLSPKVLDYIETHKLYS